MDAKVLAFTAALALSGCYSSQITGDAGTPDTLGDTHSDTVTDTASDPGTDPVSDTVTDPGDWECTPPDPAPDGPSVGFMVDGETSSMEPVDIFSPCIVEAIMEEEVGHHVIDLGCGTGALIEHHRLEIFVAPTTYMAFWEGSEVMFEYISDPIWWVNRWFAIRDLSGNLLIAGVDADRVAPEYGVSDFFEPLQVSVLGDLCPPQPADWCGEVERVALDVTYWDARGIIPDSTAGYVGELATAHVLVDEATRYVDMDCDDIPGAFYRALFVLPPEG